MNEIKTVNQLAQDRRFKAENPCFFSPSNLRFFGERKSEMKILPEHESVEDRDGVHECIVLITIQHNAPKGCALNRAHYFDVNTLKRVFPLKEN